MRGGDKLLEQIAGQPLLQVMLERALAATEGSVLCALPGPDHPRSACLGDLRVTPIFVPDAAEGMGASLRAGVAALPADASAVMILPADMPELTADDLRKMLTAQKEAPDMILRAVDCDGIEGHPVIFPADLFPALGTCHGDTGARDVLRAHSGRIVTVPLPDRHATTDLDTPEDWAAWRAKNSGLI
jgi:molybdenum cofactor cytidylyltransferase